MHANPACSGQEARRRLTQKPITAAVVATAKATSIHDAGCSDSRAMASNATSRFSV